jgi:hypothetical protein
MLRKRLLQHDPVNRCITVEGREPLAHGVDLSRMRKERYLDRNPEALARALEGLNVGEARLVLADEDDDEFGMSSAFA